MDTYQIINIILETLVAIGTLGAIVVAIWGERLRAKIVGPQVLITLRSKEGNLTKRNDGTRTHYYHLRISNSTKRNSAQKSRIFVTEIYKKNARGDFTEENLLTVPIQLTWVNSNISPIEQNISGDHFCDLGFLDENEKRFWLSTYVRPNDFQGWISKEQGSMKVVVIVKAENYVSEPKGFEIFWNGVWTENEAKMEKYLVIDEL